MYDISYHGINEIVIKKKNDGFFAHAVIDYEIENVDQDEMRQVNISISLKNPNLENWAWDYGYLEVEIDQKKLEKDIIYDLESEGGINWTLGRILRLFSAIEEKKFENINIIEVRSDTLNGVKLTSIRFFIDPFERIVFSAIFKNKNLSMLDIKTLYEQLEYEVEIEEISHFFEEYFTKTSPARLEFLF
jgi:hypothetical protein